MLARVELYQEVVGRISGKLEEEGLLLPDKELSGRILVPTIQFSQDRRTSNVYRNLGPLSNGSLIFVRPSVELHLNHDQYEPYAGENNKAVLSAREITEEVGEGEFHLGYPITHTVSLGYSVKLSSPFLRNTFGQKVAFMLSKDGHLSLDEAEKNPAFTMPEAGINLGAEDTQDSQTLLFIKEATGLIHIRALSLPEKWRSLVKDWVLIEPQDDAMDSSVNISGAKPYFHRRTQHSKTPSSGRNHGRIDNGLTVGIEHMLQELSQEHSGSNGVSSEGGVGKDNDSQQAKDKYWAEKASKKSQKGK